MIKVGITGGIGSGKSTVCKIFAALNIPIFYSDIEAAKVVRTSATVKRALTDAFGPEIYEDYGMLNKKLFASLIFSNKQSLEKANSIIHPAVRQAFRNWCMLYPKAPFVLNEAAILFESGAYREVDKTIVVSAPIDIRIERTMKRDSISHERVMDRIKSQWKEENLIEKADFVIINDDRNFLTTQVLELYRKLQI